MEITRNDLKNYKNMQLLLQELDDEINAAHNTYKSPSLSSDGSSRPLTANSPVERAMRRIERLEKKRDEVAAKVETCEKFVDSIEDPLTQSIFRYHFIDGYSWEATCLHIRKHESKSVMINIANRYFEQAGLN